MDNALSARVQSLELKEREILPKNIKPLHYEIKVEPHLEEAEEFDGTVMIDMIVLNETTSITVNAIDLEISATEVLTEDGKALEVASLCFDEDKERETVDLKEKLTVGQKIRFKQSYKGSLLNQSTAFFRSPVTAADGSIKWMVSTQLEATDARRVFPCFDEPAWKASFTITLIASKTLTCLSNMDVASETDIGNDKKSVTFNKTPLMSTYIVAFAIGDLKMIETSSFRVPVRVYASSDKNIGHGTFALHHAARTLAIFEKIFDFDYPLPKMDLIAIPGGDGAMENWGLVCFGDSLLLVDEEETSADAFRQAGSTIVHELAHQWFGNLVTMQFWDGLWLNESFADWAELYAWETLDPSWQMWLDYASQAYQDALILDGNRASHSIEVPVYKATEIDQIFDDISYSKGCAVLRMISRHLGIEVFIEGVRKYLKKAAYGNSMTSDLWIALSEVSGEDVGAMMDPWTKHTGYPVLHVTEDETAGSITVTQHRYFMDGIAKAEDDETVFPLNLRIRTKDGVNDYAAFNERTKTLKVPLDFFKINADNYGFYRVLYTPQRLQILGQNAKDGLLSPEDRIGLITDALAMAGSNRAKTSTALSLLEMFDREDNFFVWKQILDAIDFIHQAWMFEDERVTDGLRAFQARLVSKCLLKKGWNFNGDDQVEQMFKALIFSHSGQNPQVQTAAREMFDAFLAGDSKAININIQEAVFAIVLEHGGVEEYESILKAIKTASSIDKCNTCLQALGYATNPALIERTLAFAMSPEIMAINEYDRVLRSLTHHAAGREALWEWLKINAEKLEKKLGGGSGRLGMVIEFCTAKLSTRAQYEDVRGFFEGRNTEEYSSALAQSTGMIWAIVTWVERDRENVEQWLEEHGYLAEKLG